MTLISYLKDQLSRFGRGPVWRGGPGEMVLTLYDDGTILDVSTSANEMIGAAGRLTGRSLFDFVDREDRVSIRKCLKRAVAQRKCAVATRESMTFDLLRVRRTPIQVEISVKPVGQGRLIALICEAEAVRNSTPVPRQVKPVPLPLPDLSKAAPLEVDASLPPERLADLSHEMKTPLNAIMGFADAMRAETFGPLGNDKYKEYVDHIYGSGEHLMGLIGSILDYAKLGAGGYNFAPELVAPGSIVADCAAMIRGEAEAVGLSLDLDVASDLPETLIDTQAVKQILINLLSNAVKFTETGGITLSLSHNDGVLDFTVTDTGIGMSQIAMAKLGGRYTELHQNGVRGTTGSGLGLSLAFALAKLHGGVLALESRPGNGTIARFSLPIMKSLEDRPELWRSRPGDIQSQLDRVAQFRRERALKADAA